MTLEKPLWLQNLTYTAREDRGLIGDLVGEGILTSTDLAVTQRAAGANMSVDVAAGSCYITGDDQAEQGTYRCRNTATVNLTISAADPTNPRIDLVVARVRDSNVTGGSDDFLLQKINGTPAASPTVPALINGAIPLAQVAVATGAASIVTANITDRRTPAVPAVPTVSAVVSRNATALATVTGVTSYVSFPTEDDDSFGMFNPALPEQLTAVTAGLYLVTGYSAWAVNNVGYRLTRLHKNGVAFVAQRQDAADESEASLSRHIRLVAGDALKLQVFQNSTGNLNLMTAALTAHRVSS